MLSQKLEMPLLLQKGCFFEAGGQGSPQNFPNLNVGP